MAAAAIAANAHGRGLTMGPIVSDVEAFTLVAPDGELRPHGAASTKALL